MNMNDVTWRVNSAQRMTLVLLVTLYTTHRCRVYCMFTTLAQCVLCFVLSNTSLFVFPQIQ